VLDPSELACPAPQLLQDEAPPKLKVPAEHNAQVVDALAAVYFPASQGSHEAWPVAPCAEPAEQPVQLVEAVLEAKDPDEQDWHTIVASVGVKSPTGQALQLVAPESTWTTRPPPASAASSEAYVPTAHVAQWEEPSLGAAWPAPQAMHDAEERARAVDDEVPAGQGTHVQLE